MGKATVNVEQFMATLEHPMKAEIEAVRAIIRGVNPLITEQVKWNAPSFGVGGDDRVTLRLQPGNRLEVIFHRGAKVKDATGFAFEDPSGLMQWLAPDRAVIKLADMNDVQAKKSALTDVVGRWVEATR